MNKYEFDRIMSEPYPDDAEWVVLPLAKPSIDKDIARFLEETCYRLMNVFGFTLIEENHE